MTKRNNSSITMHHDSNKPILMKCRNYENGLNFNSFEMSFKLNYDIAIHHLILILLSWLCFVWLS